MRLDGDPLQDVANVYVAERVALLHRQVLRYLARSGRLRRAAEEVQQPEPGMPLLAELHAASVQFPLIATPPRPIP